jgi:hypothetical protein
MADVVVGARRYLIRTTRRDSAWRAFAERADNAERFGVECGGSSEAEAIGRLQMWLTWQDEHSSAFEALQLAERTYYRLAAGSGFTSPTEGSTAVELQRESLEEIDRARRRLDRVRGRRPAIGGT